MNCEVTLTINTTNGPQEIVLGATDQTSISSVKLKELLSKLSSKELASIINSFPKIDDIVDISKIDIKENSAGVYTPADLISTLPTNYQQTLTKLNLDFNLLNSNIIIAGFGDSSLRTQYIKETNHIFLNLNYAYDQDNKVIALFETALYLKNPINYEESVKKLLDNVVSSEIKNNIIKSAFSNIHELSLEDINLIKSIYDFLELKQSGSEIGKDFINQEDRIREFYDKFNLNAVNTKRDLNYLPHEKHRIETVQRGDLIQINYQDKTKYEVFYSYHIDSNGNIVAKTYSPGGREKTINNRVLSNNIVTVRKLDPTVYTIKPGEAGLTIKFTDKLFYTKFKYIYDLVKNQGIKIGDKTIKSLIGSTITFADNSTINVTEVKELTLTKKNLTFKSETALQKFANVVKLSHIKTIPNQTKILYDVVENGIPKYKEGLVISKGQHGDLRSEMLIVLTSNEKGELISKKILAKDVDYLIGEEPISLTTQNTLQNIINSIYRSNDLNEFLENKNQRLLNFNYSIEQVNQSTSFAEGDIVYDFSMQKFYKILDTTNESLIVSTIINNIPVYLELDPSTLKKAILFSQLPTLASFNTDYAAKNRRKIGFLQDPTQGNFVNQQNIESIQIKAVLQKPNGFIYPVTEEEIKNPSLNLVYDSNDLDITDAYKNWLNTRFNTSTNKNTPLFIYRYKDSKSFLNDQYNTRHFKNSNPNNLKESLPFTTEQLKSIIPNLVPGSYITFENNKKAFIVEKILGSQVLLSAYHNTNAVLNNGQTVVGEKFVLNLDQLSKKVYAIFVPNWATNNIKNIERILVPIERKASKVGIFSNEDSPEIIIKVANYIADKYGLKVNYIDTGNIAAYATASDIFINLNKASIEEPVHELMHLILTTLKAKDYNTYYQIIQSIQNHPLFQEVSRLYDEEINIDKLEETFVKLLSKTFRNKILTEGIFTTEMFDEAFKNTIKELFNLSSDLSSVDTNNLLTKSVNELMTVFGSRLLEETNTLIDTNDNIRMLQISNIIKTMRDNNNLIENCK